MNRSIPTDDVRRLLQGHAPFSSLTGEAVADLCAQVSSQSFLAQEHLFVESGDDDNLWLVASGTVKLIRFSQAGGQHVFHLRGEGELMNEEAAFDGCASSLTAIAVTPVVSWTVPSRCLQALVCGNPAFALAVIRYFASRQRGLISYIKDLTLRSAKARVARFMLDQTRGTCDRTSDLPRSLIAAHLNMTPETFSRALRALQLDGAIESSREAILVLCAERLAGAAQHTPADLI